MTPKPRLRDAEGSLLMFLLDRLPTVPLMLASVPDDTRKSAEWAEVRLDWRPRPVPAGALPYVVGEVNLDVYRQQADKDNPARYDLAARPRLIDVLAGALETAKVPIADLTAFDAGAALTGFLALSYAQGATSSFTVTGGAGFPASGELTIGGERIGYTGRIEAGADGVFSGITRALGQTSDVTHPAGAPVASALGSEVGYFDFGETDTRDLGFDVAVARMRSLVVVPFTASYTAG